MTTNQIPALVSSCGGKAKPINPFNKTFEDAGVTHYNQRYMDFEAKYPELPLTTPMPPNSTIMVESEPVWQWKDYDWVYFDTDKFDVKDIKNSVYTNKYGFKYECRLAYRPITADQQSEGEKFYHKENAELNKVIEPEKYQCECNQVEKGECQYFENGECVRFGTRTKQNTPQPIPGKSASGETVERLYTESEVKLIATRFARQSRLMGDVTSNDTITSFDNWFTPDSFQWQQSKILQGVVEVIEGIGKSQQEVRIDWLLTQIKNLK